MYPAITAEDAKRIVWQARGNCGGIRLVSAWRSHSEAREWKKREARMRQVDMNDSHYWPLDLGNSYLLRVARCC